MEVVCWQHQKSMDLKRQDGYRSDASACTHTHIRSYARTLMHTHTHARTQRHAWGLAPSIGGWLPSIGGWLPRMGVYSQYWGLAPQNGGILPYGGFAPKSGGIPPREGIPPSLVLVDRPQAIADAAIKRLQVLPQNPKDPLEAPQAPELSHEPFPLSNGCGVIPSLGSKRRRSRRFCYHLWHAKACFFFVPQMSTGTVQSIRARIGVTV